MLLLCLIFFFVLIVCGVLGVVLVPLGFFVVVV